MANAPSLLIGPKDNSKYAGVSAPSGYQFGTADNSQQMWAGNKLVTFRPLVPIRSAATGFAGSPVLGNQMADKIRASYGLKPATAPADPKPTPVIQGGAAILSGQSTPGRGDVAAEDELRRRQDANAKQGTYRPTAVAAPDTATKILLGG